MSHQSSVEKLKAGRNNKNGKIGLLRSGFSWTDWTWAFQRRIGDISECPHLKFMAVKHEYFTTGFSLDVLGALSL